MNLVYQSAFLKALGWSLLDSLWQIGLLWLAYIWLTANGKKYESRQRHSIALLSLAGGSGWFLGTLVMHCYQLMRDPQIILVSATEAATFTRPQPLSGLFATWFEPVLPFLSAIYLFVLVFLFIRFYRQYHHARQLASQLQKADPEWRAFLQQAAGHLGIKKKVQIWLSALVDTPLTIGFWKPVILLPVAAINHLSLQQAEAIILHELQHIKRNDYLVNLLLACAGIILFFNPFARLLADIIKKERENSCDDLVLQFRYDAGSYAAALLSLEKNRCSPAHALAMAATGKSKQLLLHRVQRMLTKQPVPTPLNHTLIAYLLCALLIGFIGWYNPGKVIIRTIQEVSTTSETTDDDLSAYATPVIQVNNILTATEGENRAVKNNNTICKKSSPKKCAEDTEAEEPVTAFFTNAQLADLVNNQAAPIAAAYEFANNFEARDYSLPQPETVPLPATGGSLEEHPFVPGSSFLYQYQEDTTQPKRYVPTNADIQAKDALDRSLKALQAIDWQKMEKELVASGMKKIDIIRLQTELRKAMKEIDWKKINADVQASMTDAALEIQREQQAVSTELNRYQQERAAKQAARKRIEAIVVQDRLLQNQPAGQSIKKKKKVVVI